MAYRLALPLQLDRVHNVFRVSQLRKYLSNPTHVILPEQLGLDEKLVYEEMSEKILDAKSRKTRGRETKLVKVLWSNHDTEEATWETEDSMRSKYPFLFSKVKFS